MIGTPQYFSNIQTFPVTVKRPKSQLTSKLDGGAAFQREQVKLMMMKIIKLGGGR